MTSYISQTTARIWSLAELLRGDFKQSQFGRVILPFTILRRLECMLESTKPNILEQVEKLENNTGIDEATREMLLIKAANQSFYNTSHLDLSKLTSSDTKSNLASYIESFSPDALDIFEHFRFSEFVARLDNANLLHKVVQQVALTDLSQNAISNYDMSLVFEDLIRRFAESSNENAGEHFTPRDVLRLTTSLVFLPDTEALTKQDTIRNIYDPTAGTGGFLSTGMEHVHKINPELIIRAFGQELNPESYAICKGYMLIKGQDVSYIKLGNTLNDDQLKDEKFDYMLSNPPFGVEWKNIESEIKEEHQLRGFHGRFGAGLPRVSDGSLLFLMHLIDKMRNYDLSGEDTGGRIGIILNGTPLFTGGAGSGESEIRRHILEADLLEAIVALPTDMFYNTGVATYIWVLSNKKNAQRKGTIQLINGIHQYQKMRKGFGSKRHEISAEDAQLITRTFSNFESVDTHRLNKTNDDNIDYGDRTESEQKALKNTLGSKILPNHLFGYRRITIERPLRVSVQLTDERIETLRFESGILRAAMQELYELYGKHWLKDKSGDSYGVLKDVEPAVRSMVKNSFPDLKANHIKRLLDPKTWCTQKELLEKTVQLQAVINKEQYDDLNTFEKIFSSVITNTGIELDSKQRKNILSAVCWTNSNAEPVIKEVLKDTNPDPTYGIFEYRGAVVRFKPDRDLRDNENVKLTAESAHGINVDALNKTYFDNEIAPFVTDAWIDKSKTDKKDGQVGVVGYEIHFGRFFTDAFDTSPDGERVRLKTVINKSVHGRYVWAPAQMNFRESSSDDTADRFDLVEEVISPEYFDLFLSLPESEEWKIYASVGSTVRTIPFRRLVECVIQLPDLATQRKIVRLFEEHKALKARINLLGADILNNHIKAEISLEKYQNMNVRFENEFVHTLPHPLSVLWVQAQFGFDEQRQCEDYIKFYEYLGLFCVSLLLGQLTPKEVNVIFNLNRMKQSKPALTMGTAFNLIRLVRENYYETINPLFRPILSKEFQNLLASATKERNSINHSSLASKVAVNDSKRTIDVLNDELDILTRDFFEQITLLHPRSTRYKRQDTGDILFVSEVNSLKGLALNPAITSQVKTREPFLEGELYIVTDGGNEVKDAHHLFPFVTIFETDNLSGILAFYFYNGWNEEQKCYRYFCPYPCAVPWQHFDNISIFNEIGKSK